MIWRLSRLRCRLFGHLWSYPWQVPGTTEIQQVCIRAACHGDHDAIRVVSR